MGRITLRGLVAKPQKEFNMLHYALVFFVLAIIAAIIFGSGAVTGLLLLGAKVCFGVFLLFAILSLVFGRNYGTPEI